jgi:hypothetical protein
VTIHTLRECALDIKTSIIITKKLIHPVKTPTELDSTKALAPLAIAAIHIICIIWPRERVNPPPFILEVIRPKTTITTIINNELRILKT